MIRMKRSVETRISPAVIVGVIEIYVEDAMVVLVVAVSICVVQVDEA